jgi:MFS transporter, SHS family, sialic acid transporter
MTEAKGLTRAQWMVLLAAFLGWMFDGFEMGLYPLVVRPALQDLLRGTIQNATELEKLIGLWNSRVVAAFLLGAATGGLVFGWLGDKIGRVRAMTLSILAYSLLTGLAYFATAPWQLVALRFVAALGMGGEWSLGVALVMECWPERHRPILAGAIGAASNFGFLAIALVGNFVAVTPDSWRWMMLVGAGPALLTFFVILFVPESERWRHAVQKAVARPIREIFSRGLRKRTLLAIVFTSIPLIGTWAAVSGWIPVWADQLGGKEMPHAKATAQVMISIGAIIGCFLAPPLCARVGRRPAYFVLCVLSLVFCALLFRTTTQYGTWFLGLTLVVGLVTASFYGWAPLYLPELFPTRVRATGQGLAFNFGRILAAAGALQMGELVRVLGGNYAKAGATITLIYVLGLFVIWLAPETRGKPLPE